MSSGSKKLLVIIEDVHTEKQWVWPFGDVFVPQLKDYIHMPVILSDGSRRTPVWQVSDRYVTCNSDHIRIMIGVERGRDAQLELGEDWKTGEITQPYS